MNGLKGLILIGIIYFVSASLVFASTSVPASVGVAPVAGPIRSAAEIENSCRMKSKEIALETYRGCVTDAKTAQIEQVRRQYKVKLLALKAYYENELKKMSSASAAATQTAAPAAPAVKSQDDMKVQIVHSPTVAPAAASAADESAPDMPEPIPVETK